VETDRNRTTTSNESGIFAFPTLPVGRYTLNISKEGFSAYTQNGIVINVSQTASMPVTLKVGSIQESVTVTEETAMVNTTDSVLSRLVDQKQVEGLPLNGRNPANLVFLAPGVSNPVQNVPTLNTGSPVLQNSLVYPTAIAPTVNGVRGGGVYFSLDGANNIDPYQVTGGPFPNPDATLEFSVVTNAYGARYVSAPGGVVSIVTKSGTNQFHGSLFHFFRNGEMNARNFFAARQDLLKRNQFGFTAGMPIVKNKLFVFGSYQRMILRDQVGGQIAFVPNAAERAGDFSGRSAAIRDPDTSAPFAGNRIPATRLDPVIQRLNAFVPLPQTADGRIVFSRPVQQNEHQPVVKVDYVLSDSQRLFGRYLYSNFDWDGVAIPNNNILASFRGQTHRWDSAVFGHTLARSAWVNDFRFAFIRNNSSTFAGQNTVSLQNLGARLTPGQFPTIQSLAVTGFFTVAPGNFNAWPRDNYDIANHVTWVKGRHEVSLGAEVQRIFTRLLTDNGQNIGATFGTAATGFALSDYMLGRPGNLNQSDGISIDVKGTLWGFYVEDKIRVSQRLNLTAGLRWDPYWPFQGQNGRMQCFRPGLRSQVFTNAPVGLVYPGDPGCNAAGTSSNLATIQPRVGLAYKLDKEGKTVVRAGYGLYTQQPQTAGFLAFGRVQPFVRSFNIVNPPSIADPWSTFPGGNPFASGFRLDAPVNRDAPFINPGIANTFAPIMRLTYIQQWNVTLERALTRNDVLQVSYVGTKGTRLSLVADYNQPVFIPGQSTQANSQARRPIQQIAQLNGTRDDGNSNYNALQVSLRHRARAGLSLAANMTWSKSIDYTSSPANVLLTGGGIIPDPGNPRLRRGPSDFDTPVSVRGSFVWDIPYGKSLRGAAAHLLAGWQINGLATWDSSGFPISVTAPFNNSLTGLGQDFADYVGGQPLRVGEGATRNDRLNRWFNTAAFVPNAIGTYGNAGRNIIYSPGTVNFDFAVVKNFRVTERIGTLFRTEFFNMFNTPNFLPPGNALGAPTLGRITAARDPRILQLSLKVNW